MERTVGHWRSLKNHAAIIAGSPTGGLMIMLAIVLLSLLSFVVAGRTGNPLWLTAPTLPYLAYVLRRHFRRCLGYYRSLWPWSWASAAGLAVVALSLTVALFVAETFFIPATLRDWSLGTLFHIGALSGSNAAIVPLSYPALAALYAPALLLSLPLLAWIEEDIFRKGTTTWANGIARSVAFGLAHLTMGVSVGGCLALSGAGLVFTHAYFRALDDKKAVERLDRLPHWALIALFQPRLGLTEYAVFRATQVHLVYNALAVIVALLALVAH